MKPLRIVLVMIEPPLPFGNAAARWYYVLLKGLVERGHRVTAFAGCSKPAEILQAKQLFASPDYDLRLYPFPHRRGIWSKLETLRRPYSYMFSPELRQDLERELAAGYDILHLEQLWSAWLGLDRQRAFVNVHFLGSLDLAGITSTIHQRIHYRLLKRAERLLISRMVTFGAISDRLETELWHRNSLAKVLTTRLGLDVDRYPVRQTQPDPSRPVIGLIGSMNWYPSYSAAKRLLTEICPRVRVVLPDTKVLIVGWCARKALAEHVNDPNVEIIEDVADTAPYFQQLSVLVYAPARGTGVKVKVQEAFAYGIPVVTNTEGVEGLAAEDGIHAVIHDDSTVLAERTIELLRHPERGIQMARSARKMLIDHCGPTASLEVIEAAYAELLKVSAGVLTNA